MVGSAGKGTYPLRQFAFNEHGWPVRDAVPNVEVHVMNFNVSQVTADDLGHRSRSSGHPSQSVPHPVLERIPRRLKKLERTFEVTAKFSGRPARAGVCGRFSVVADGVELADLAHSGTPEEQGMGFGLVSEVCNHVPACESREQARGKEVVVQRRKPFEQTATAHEAYLDAGGGLHHRNLPPLISATPSRYRRVRIVTI